MRLLKFGALSCALSVSACTLDIDFVGEGTVFTEDQSIFCTQSCLKRSISSLKKVTLQATPAAGYAFYGFVGHSKFKFLDFPEETLYGTYPETGLYEYGYGVVAAYEGPADLVSVPTDVTALFLPEGYATDVVYTSGSICVHTQDLAAQCWGRSQDLNDKSLNGQVQGLVAEAADDMYRDDLCILTDSAAFCWNEESGQPWADLNVSMPTAGALYYDTLCLIHEGSGTAEVSCVNAQGELQSAPEFNAPEAIWADSEAGFCAEDSLGVQCWGKT